MSHPHTLCIGASRWRKHSLCREGKRVGDGERRGRKGRRWEGGREGKGEKRRSKGELKERVERVKVVDGRDATALYNCLHKS